MECHVCFESGGGTDQEPLSTQLCGRPQCVASICRSCLTSHIRVALDDCYAGVLPKIRCPFCLANVNKTQWMTHIDTSDDVTKALTLGRYETFCKKACSFQAPCCHKVDYSHLPEDDVESVRAIDSVTPNREPESAPDNDDDVKCPEELTTLCREFCFHRGDSRTVIQSVLEQCQDSDSAAVDAVVKKTLGRIIDDERRATLLLSYLYLRPLSQTRCCKTNFCFNCKRRGHHEKCDVDEIQVDQCLVQCRSCRIMILKVEGCDSVTCVCGFSMGWVRETQIQALYRKQLVPVDFFDKTRFEEWDKWRQRLLNVCSGLEMKIRDMVMQKWTRAYSASVRQAFGNKICLTKWKVRTRKLVRCIPEIARAAETRRWLSKYVPLLRHGFQTKIWQVKWRLQTRKLVRCIPEIARAAETRRWLSKYAPLLRQSVSTHIWWRRYCNTYPEFRLELFWRVFFKNHAWEVEEQHEYEAALLKIAV